MKRRHRMPFGAQLSDGAARFRLWAPAAARVDLQVAHEEEHRTLSMHADGDGWYSLVLPGIAAGARYRFRIDDRIDVPDPASRCNPEDVHAASMLVDPAAFDWPDTAWRGRPWEEAVVYELHLGTFTPPGTFTAAIERLDYLAALGVTAIELMPVADFPGKRNWGYDGVLPFAPDASYGTPEDLKKLVAAAHARGLMVLLDVVYNHFGPEGNYLHEYAPQFFNPAHQTPWGAAINFDGEDCGTVRDFFVHNALYWLEEFNLDGLRLDAVHAIVDGSDPDIVSAIAAAVRAGPGRARHVHIVLENDRNDARYLRRDAAGRTPCADAQWNDDAHHALHVLATGERDGYYIDYADQPLKHLGRALAEGFAYQGEPSAHRRGAPRGKPSAALPPSAFVAFMQCHDQVGNRAFGERIASYSDAARLRLAMVCLLLAPQVPMLFMGEEFASSSPFLFFCDFGPELARAVRDGRRREFAAFERFRDEAAQREIPDPNAAATFTASKLQWDEIAAPGHREWHALYRELLALRHRLIVPHLAGAHHAARYTVEGDALAVDWTLPDGTGLGLRANFSSSALVPAPVPGSVIYATAGARREELPACAALWALEAHG